jgi:hypothetical protein
VYAGVNFMGVGQSDRSCAKIDSQPLGWLSKIAVGASRISGAAST